MARRVEVFDVVVSGSVPRTAPQVTLTRFDPGVVERITVTTPAGMNGLVGWGIMHGGASVLPREEGRWYRLANGESSWDVEDLPDAGDWRVRMYNDGIYNHTLQFRFHVSELPGRETTATAPVSIEQTDQLAPAATEPGFPEEA